MDPKKTGTIILESRKKLNMTQKNLADKLYVSDKAVSKWERGLCFPDISVLIPLTEILNISLYDLLRGERMNKNEVEETLKNTINYSNSELKRKKKKYMTMSSIVIAIVVLISSIALLYINNKDISAIVDRDTIHDISYYSNYKTSLDSINGEKLELIIMKLPLKWKERQFKVNRDTLIINYGVSYKDVVKAYNDEAYVKEAMINNASIIFTTVSGVNSVEIRYTDYNYAIYKKELRKAYGISSFDEVIEKDNWNKLISEKLIDDNFINDTFNLFEKNIEAKNN